MVVYNWVELFFVFLKIFWFPQCKRRRIIKLINQPGARKKEQETSHY